VTPSAMPSFEPPRTMADRWQPARMLDESKPRVSATGFSLSIGGEASWLLFDALLASPAVESGSPAAIEDRRAMQRSPPGPIALPSLASALRRGGLCRRRPSRRRRGGSGPRISDVGLRKGLNMSRARWGVSEGVRVPPPVWYNGAFSSAMA